MQYVFILSLAFMVIYFAKTLIKSKKGKKLLNQNDTVDEKYNAVKRMEMNKVDQLLDKIAKSGEESLTLHEKEVLENYSKK